MIIPRRILGTQQLYVFHCGLPRWVSTVSLSLLGQRTHLQRLRRRLRAHRRLHGALQALRRHTRTAARR
jgi:site-specific recombinase